MKPPATLFDLGLKQESFGRGRRSCFVEKGHQAAGWAPVGGDHGARINAEIGSWIGGKSSVVAKPDSRICHVDYWWANLALVAPAPPRVVVGGFASAGLIAWALTAKFCDHLPHFRQEKMLTRWGAPISHQKLCDWVGAATALLEPLVKRMKQDLLQSRDVQVDETPIRCNDLGLRDGQTTTGWLWALARP